MRRSAAPLLFGELPREICGQVTSGELLIVMEPPEVARGREMRRRETGP
jgi:hypothetical protein